MQPIVTIDRQQLIDFERTIASTIEQGKKSVSGAMIQASVFASQSAAGSVYGRTNSGRFRQFGKKNRNSRKHKRIEQAKDARGRFIRGVSAIGKDGRPWWSIGSVDMWAKGKKNKRHFRKLSTFNKARRIPRRGLAGHATTKTDGMISRIVMDNSLQYIQKVAPNSAREGIAVANRKLSGILKKNLARDIEKAFQKRSRG
jgi:hypothetical protein